MKINLILEKTKRSFELQAEKDFAEWQKSYMLNKFDFLGIRTTKRREIQKTIFSELKIETENQLHDLVLLFWNQSEREFHYVAIELLFKYKKLFGESTFELVEKLIRSNSWWDSVDFIAANILGTLITKYPHLRTKMNNWVNDQDMWIRRSALLFQLKYKNKTDFELLSSYCKTLAHEKEFFIRKAIGWVLREYSKTNPIHVKNFVENNKNILSNLSLKEASKYI